MSEGLSIGQMTTYLKKYLVKFRGNRRSAPLVSPAPLDIMVSGLGSGIALSILAALSMVYKMPMIVASFGASAILIYGAPDAPLSQPRNVIFGHLLSAAVGVTIYRLFGFTWTAAAMATTIALILMLITKTTHPPGGATALFAVLGRAEPIYILTPVVTGAVIMVIVGILTNNLSPNRQYPRYWW